MYSDQVSEWALAASECHPPRQKDVVILRTPLAREWLPLLFDLQSGKDADRPNVDIDSRTHLFYGDTVGDLGILGTVLTREVG